MAIKPVLSVRDSAVNAYMAPFAVPAIGAGVRGFVDEVNKRGQDAGPLAAHPEDYELFHVADWDEDNGVFVQVPNGPVSVIRGKDAVKAPQ